MTTHAVLRPLSLALALLPLVLSTACDDDAISRGADIGRPDFDVVDAFADSACIRRDEVCDGVDNSCNGLVDEDDPELLRKLFDDADNCGACGNTCGTVNATAGCSAGQCYITACEPGFNDADGNYDNGCESDCIISRGGREVCDNEDNDCDGMVDEGFDLSSDIAHCGACDNGCLPPMNGVSVCVESTCGLGECEPGFIDLDGDPTTGCEYACVPNGDAEFCNGLDDDCDGGIDEQTDLTTPENFCGDVGGCQPECSGGGDCDAGEVCNQGACVLQDGGPVGQPCEIDADCTIEHPGYACVAGSEPGAGGPASVRRCVRRQHAPVCDGDRGFRCLRRPEWQAGNEQGRCDDYDNDCDGRVDEDYVNQLFLDGANRSIPRTCQDGLGICQREETYRCADDGNGTICPVAPAEPERDDDDCNARDDDCDGRVDEAFEDAWVDLGPFEVYAYEAVRPGADDFAPGLDLNPDDGVPAYIETRACSRAGALPWANVTFEDAERACEAAGARLCTADEWLRACGGAGRPSAYPYGDDYEASSCNGGGYDVEPLLPGLQDAAVVTGDLPLCENGGVHDASGNLKEWIDERDADLRAVRGGGFETNVPAGLTCDQDIEFKPDGFRSGAIGFRCCR